MTHIPHATKLRIFLGLCAAWTAAGAWLVGCVVAEAPLRMTVGAAVALLLLSVAVAVVKHDLELEAARRINARPMPAGSDDDWEKGEA